MAGCLLKIYEVGDEKKVRLFILKSHNYEANLQVTEWALRIYYKFFEEESDVIITEF